MSCKLSIVPWAGLYRSIVNTFYKGIKFPMYSICALSSFILRHYIQMFSKSFSSDTKKNPELISWNIISVILHLKPGLSLPSQIPPQSSLISPSSLSVLQKSAKNSLTTGKAECQITSCTSQMLERDWRNIKSKYSINLMVYGFSTKEWILCSISD